MCIGHQKTLAQWLDYITCQHTKSMDFDLSRVHRVGACLGLLQPQSKIVTIAGTNGKGTTGALVATVLSEAGFQVGLFSSPHLLDYTERVLINQCVLSPQEHCQAFAVVEVSRDVPLTYFEFSTLAALWLFSQHTLDVIILEVGLGGRLDATNIVDADLAIVTSIGLDHCEYLGNTRESIGREKAGIIRAYIPVICGDLDPPQSLLDACMSQQAHFKQVPSVAQNNTLNWDFNGEHWTLPQLNVPSIPLQNAATALSALETLYPELSIDAVRRGLDAVFVQGRLQTIRTLPTIIVDVAHNPHAARYLHDQLSRNKQRRYTFVVGMLAHKDIEGVLKIMRPLASDWCFVDLLEHECGARASELARKLQGEQVRCFRSVAQALQTLLLTAGADTHIVVMGSTYTVAQALRWHQQKQREQ